LITLLNRLIRSNTFTSISANIFANELFTTINDKVVLNSTTYYYLGSRLVAKRTATTLNYIHQDHLTGTALMTSDNGTQVATMRYYPYGDCRSSTGTLGTDKLFTGQRLDDTGLYSSTSCENMVICCSLKRTSRS